MIMSKFLYHLQTCMMNDLKIILPWVTVEEYISVKLQQLVFQNISRA